MNETLDIRVSREGMDAPRALRELIALRAYELYELRGRKDGFDLEDWLQAEREVLADNSSPQAPGPAKAPYRPSAGRAARTTRTDPSPARHPVGGASEARSGKKHLR